MKNRKELKCPICGRTFVQSSWNQRYCGRGCSDTAHKIGEIKRMAVRRVDEVLGNGKQQE